MSNCTNVPADDIGCVVYTIHQYQNKPLQFVFETEDPGNPGTYIPIDLTTYTDVKIQFRQNSTRSGKLWKEYSVGSGLVIEGVDDNILTLDIPDDFYSDKMPTELKFDVLYEIGGKTNHYLDGTLKILNRQTAP